MSKRQRFVDWCNEDPTDERKINYTCYIGGRFYTFTSEDNMPIYEGGVATLRWLREEAMVDNVQLINNEWYIELSE